MPPMVISRITLDSGSPRSGVTRGQGRAAAPGRMSKGGAK